MPEARWGGVPVPDLLRRGGGEAPEDRVVPRGVAAPPRSGGRQRISLAPALMGGVDVVAWSANIFGE